ncbi:hypothetical protein PJ985_11485 [Streptomyces sp. ACA25]|nr:hypothetical protein [Streptomyces sp. ACA25]MDB1088186.1 hypothetical protein [Streptomyces sp. ACA25]
MFVTSANAALSTLAEAGDDAINPYFVGGLTLAGLLLLLAITNLLNRDR